jgi:NADPH-dependent glutamate synthase beta subunit-like oxidoreductase/ferredoxin
MPAITIDGHAVEVAAGQTVLDAARKLGLDIPTLCHLEKCAPMTSCLVCLVKINANGQSRLAPSCATPAVEGMAVESETDEVHDARRTALELLLSDHVGDCLSPCHRICPLRLNIPVMIRQIEAGRLDEAIVTVRTALALPLVLGRLCHHPCEGGCRRGTWDQPAAIREMERFVADHDAGRPSQYSPPRQPASGKSVAIIGAGPTGLAAADRLLREGHACTVFDRHPQAGGSLRAEVTAGQLSVEILNTEIAQIERLGARFMLGLELGREVALEDLRRDFDAVILATGQLGKDEAGALGLALTTAGIKTDPITGLTCLAGVFAAGSAVKPARHLVRAMSEGVNVAASVHHSLAGGKPHVSRKPFSSVMGRLEEGEINVFLKGPSPAQRVAPACGLSGGFTDGEAPAEAARCLHCDCRAAGNCQLQHYAQVYGADAGRFREQRRRFEQHRQAGDVIFEPGKCIVCGICVHISQQASEPLGLTFIGRGFDVRVGAPLNHTVSEGLQKVAAECVEQCPTGALSFHDPQRGLALPCHSGGGATACRPHTCGLEQPRTRKSSREVTEPPEEGSAD